MVLGFLCWYLSLNDTYQKMVTDHIFSFSSASFTCPQRAVSQTKLQHVPRIRVRVFIAQAVQCVICIHYSNCIVPYIRVERNILNLIIREVKSSIFKSPISKLLKCQFCFHVRDGRICDSWRSNIAIHVLKIAELIYLPYSPEILKVYSNYYMFHVTLE